MVVIIVISLIINYASIGSMRQNLITFLRVHCDIFHYGNSLKLFYI